jgi:hypothetical protein
MGDQLQPGVARHPEQPGEFGRRVAALGGIQPDPDDPPVGEPGFGFAEGGETFLFR